MTQPGGGLSAVTEPTSTTRHKNTLDAVKVLVKEESVIQKKVEVAIAIHKNTPALKRDRGHEILFHLVPCD